MYGRRTQGQIADIAYSLIRRGRLARIPGLMAAADAVGLLRNQVAQRLLRGLIDRELQPRP
jgi:hypothetical protein